MTHQPQQHAAKGWGRAIEPLPLTYDERHALLWAIANVFGETYVAKEEWPTSALGMLLDDVRRKLSALGEADRDLGTKPQQEDEHYEHHRQAATEERP